MGSNHHLSTLHTRCWLNDLNHITSNIQSYLIKCNRSKHIYNIHHEFENVYWGYDDFSGHNLKICHFWLWKNSFNLTVNGWASWLFPILTSTRERLNLCSRTTYICMRRSWSCEADLEWPKIIRLSTHWWFLTIKEILTDWEYRLKNNRS